MSVMALALVLAACTTSGVPDTGREDRRNAGPDTVSGVPAPPSSAASGAAPEFAEIHVTPRRIDLGEGESLPLRHFRVAGAVVGQEDELEVDPRLLEWRTDSPEVVAVPGYVLHALRAGEAEVRSLLQLPGGRTLSPFAPIAVTVHAEGTAFGYYVPSGGPFGARFSACGSVGQGGEDLSINGEAIEEHAQELGAQFDSLFVVLHGFVPPGSQLRCFRHPCPTVCAVEISRVLEVRPPGEGSC